MAFDTADIVSEEAVRDRLWEIAEENLVFRRAFEQVPVPDGTGDTWKVPVDNDALAQPDEISEGARYPTDEESYGKKKVVREKIGQAIPVTDEAKMDNAFPVVRRLVDKQGRKFAEKLNTKAFTELNANLHTNSPATSTADDVLSYDDVLAGKKELRGSGYNPDIMFIQEDGEESLLSDPDFTRSTRMGDSVVRNGEIGRASGMEVVVSNSGNLGVADAIIVDTSFYGLEGEWTEVESERVDDRLSDTEYLKARTFRGWKAMDSQAAIKVDG